MAAVPNFAQVTTRWRRLKRKEPYKSLGDYGKSGIHVTTPRLVRRWFHQAGLIAVCCSYVVPEKGKLARRLSFGMADSLLAEELICVGSSQRVIEVALAVEKRTDAVLA